MEGGKKVFAYDLVSGLIDENFPLTEYQHFYHTCGTVRYKTNKLVSRCWCVFLLFSCLSLISITLFANFSEVQGDGRSKLIVAGSVNANGGWSAEVLDIQSGLVKLMYSRSLCCNKCLLNSFST